MSSRKIKLSPSYTVPTAYHLFTLGCLEWIGLIYLHLKEQEVTILGVLNAMHNVKYMTFWRTVEGTINGRVLGEGKGYLHELHSFFLLFSFRPSSLQKLVLITHLITGFTFMLVFWGVIHASHTMAFSSDSIHNLKWLDYTYLYFKKWIESAKNWLDIR